MDLAPTLFVMDILQDYAKLSKKILDAGCGDGVQALVLARRNPGSIVYGYDIDAAQITKAQQYREKHKISNATFSVASHDDFQYPCEMDLIYTAWSLVGAQENRDDDGDHLRLDLAGQRVARFQQMLHLQGTYIMMWASTMGSSADLQTFIEKRGFKYQEGILGRTVGWYGPFGEYIYWTGLVFSKIQDVQKMERSTTDVTLEGRVTRVPHTSEEAHAEILRARKTLTPKEMLRRMRAHDDPEARFDREFEQRGPELPEDERKGQPLK